MVSEKKRIEKVRSRQSYKFFYELSELILRGAPLESVFGFIHSWLDSQHAFHYQTRSDWASESINQVLKDLDGMKKLVLLGEKANKLKV